jgi:hypothetical protein
MPQNPEANGSTSPSEKSVLQIFIAPGPVRTANLGSNDKHAKNKTIEDEFQI